MRPAFLLLFLALAACGEPPASLSLSAGKTAALEPPKSEAAGVSNRLGISVRAALPAGVKVVAIELDGPAGEAGLQIGDVILQVNGEAVSSDADLVRLADAAGSGSRATLDIARSGEARRVAVRIGEGNGGMPNALGLRLRELPSAALKVLGLSYGLMVLRVDPPADRSRLQPGDIIVGVNQAKIRSLEEFNRLIGEAQTAAIALLVRRGASDLYVPVERSAGAPRVPSMRPATDIPLRT
jgi:serine protease Do